MALGGGKWLFQNKILPGAYINFVSLARASASLADRGYVAFPLELDWGVDGDIFTVELADVQKDSLKIFGYDYTHEKMKGVRDIFKRAKTLYAYRLNSGTKAGNTYATAKNTGPRGNDIRIKIGMNVDDNSKFDVTTMLDTVIVDQQTVSAMADIAANDYVDWKSSATLAATAGMPLAGGTNSDVTGAQYQEFLDKIESYTFNTLGCLSTTPAVCDLFASFTKRMRDDTGVKFQTVLYRTLSDYEGIISVENKTTDDGYPESSAVYWAAGASAGCPVNESNLNRVYDGDFKADTKYKQSQLEAGIKAGKFMFHQVNDQVRVLDDINTFISWTVEKNEDFASNQVVRVIDQIGNDIAVMFNTKFLGKVPNDADGRMDFWKDIVKHHQKLQKVRAIENFAPEDVTVEQGDEKKAVLVMDDATPTAAMGKLYMAVIVA